MGLLFDTGVETNIDIAHEYGYEIEIAKEYMYAPKTTKIIAPQISPQYSIVHAPQLQFNSPYGSVGGAPINQTPEVTGHTIEDTLIPTQTVEQAQAMTQGIDQGEVAKGGFENIILIGAIVLGAVLLLPMLFKKKGKVSVDPLSKKVSASSN